MATRLYKPVRRESADTYHGRPLVIEIAPPFIIRIREKRRRRAFTLTVRGAYEYAARLDAERIRRERKIARNARKEGKTCA